MKLVSLSAALAPAMILLAACTTPTQPPADLADVSAGLDAYRKGDIAALEQSISAILPRTAPAAGTPAPAPCTKEAYALRRSERARRTLAYLDQGPGAVYAEPIRYVYMEGLITGDEARSVHLENAPTDFECESDKDSTSSREADTTENYAIRDAIRNRLTAWYGELHTSMGARFDLQMKAAAKQLYIMRLRNHAEWEEPNGI